LLDLFAERRINMHDPQANVWKGAAAGLAAGLAASWAMTQFLHLYGKLSEIHEEKEEPQHSVNRGKQESAQQKEQGDDATVKAADKLSRGLFHHALSQEEKKVAGPAVHYGFGALTGVAYGALAEIAPDVTRGVGAPFGTAVWLGADEVAVPALGLSGPPWEHPASVHARAFAAHLVYGVATEGVRKLVRRAL
jgi:putative membrane protein